MTPEMLLLFFAVLFVGLACLWGRITGYNAGYTQAEKDHDLMVLMQRELRRYPDTTAATTAWREAVRRQEEID